jgi:hypothetical protein
VSSSAEGAELEPPPDGGDVSALVQGTAFSVVRKGYAPREVDALLRKVAGAVEAERRRVVRDEGEGLQQVALFAKSAVDDEVERARSEGARLLEGAERAAAAAAELEQAALADRESAESERARARAATQIAERRVHELSEERRALNDTRRQLEKDRSDLGKAVALLDQHRRVLAEQRQQLEAEIHAAAERRSAVAARLPGMLRTARLEMEQTVLRFVAELGAVTDVDTGSDQGGPEDEPSRDPRAGDETSGTGRQPVGPFA